MDRPAGTSRPKTLHLDREDWRRTARGDPRGYIDAQRLKELWFHTGTICNLRCPFCLEGSKPGDNRINMMTCADAEPFLEEALSLGVEQFSFTGGEPFVVPEFVRILSAALDHRPCLVLTNGTEPLMNRWDELTPLLDKPNRLKLRISVDYPDEKRHDMGRGPGNFKKAFQTARRLYEAGFDVSIARQRDPDEDVEAVDRQFHAILAEYGLPALNIVSFPDFLTPGARNDSVPEITEDCMTRYHTEDSRAAFMCSYTRFVLKKGGRMRVYACTLVDDDEDYDLGSTLQESLDTRVMLKHHRCFSCFAFGACCSEA